LFFTLKCLNARSFVKSFSGAIALFSGGGRFRLFHK
jgi:hypothetical protein